MEELLKELQTDLEDALTYENLTGSDKKILSSKIKGAYKDVRFARKYQDHHTEEFIDSDMAEMYSIVRKLALYDYNQVGVEGQASHSENGTSRTWEKRSDILLGVIPFVKVL